MNRITFVTLSGIAWLVIACTPAQVGPIPTVPPTIVPLTRTFSVTQAAAPTPTATATLAPQPTRAAIDPQISKSAQQVKWMDLKVDGVNVSGRVEIPDALQHYDFQLWAVNQKYPGVFVVKHTDNFHFASRPIAAGKYRMQIIFYVGEDNVYSSLSDEFRVLLYARSNSSIFDCAPTRSSPAVPLAEIASGALVEKVTGLRYEIDEKVFIKMQTAEGLVGWIAANDTNLYWMAVIDIPKKQENCR